MKQIIYILVLLSLPIQGFCYSPDNGSLSLNLTNSLFFTYNNVDEMLSPKTIDNALQLTVKTSRSGYNVSAAISFMDPSQDAVFAGKLALKLRSKTSYNAIVNAAVVPLYSTPTLLFTQPATGNTEHFNFMYDIVIGPFEHFVNAGNFNYSINITMTEP